MKLADIYLFLQADIEKIEKELEVALRARHPVLREASTELLKAGGKRIRPVFVLLAGQFGHYDIKNLQQIAVPLELIHMASLVHDDVIDDAELRRGKKTTKARWDNRVAMYTGDYIFAKAVETTTYFENPQVHQVLSNAMVEMCIGEVEQIRDQYNWGQTLRVYLRRIKRKTALLIAVSCQLGAIASGATKKVQRDLYTFGYNVGMSYQITDDILDFIGTEKELGKPAGSDLKQGNVTLPALYAMFHQADIKDMITEQLSESTNERVNMDTIIAAIKQSGGIEFSKNISDRYLQKAFEMLERLPDIPAKSSLTQIAEYIGKRKF
ncbi:heptaprenyl diphosphate synthase component II [Desertibacillus haloalkaliphilus]|uniref:heptaprenyl diphosphate synthase component II n=1 Tax=Desertibacillus haloalkaliphilus TaxID=1328930 RepID=UPI001C2581D1|nr:heptaprenyl diphosphate synthase component II [Desertibacillus haloalkaliphilus]MBU8907243.1 heptaprenyl diphosphate synthase component II [Desertibacillus haloalkaliphilus]